jgi:hypothetical protein
MSLKGETIMILGNLASMATIIEAIFVVISVLFIWRELRENTRLKKASNTQALVELSSPFNLQLIQDPKMAELWVNGAKEYPKMGEVKKYQYKSLIVWWLMLQENIYHQNRENLLDNSIYTGWANDLDYFVKKQNLAQLWDILKPSLEPKFAEHVTQLIKKHKPISPAPKAEV